MSLKRSDNLQNKDCMYIYDKYAYVYGTLPVFVSSGTCIVNLKVYTNPNFALCSKIF